MGVCPTRPERGGPAPTHSPFPLLSSLGSAPTSWGPGLGAAMAPAAACRALAASPAAPPPRRPAAGARPRPCFWTDQSRVAVHGGTQSELESPAVACWSRPRSCSILRPTVQGGWGRDAVSGSLGGRTPPSPQGWRTRAPLGEGGEPDTVPPTHSGVKFPSTRLSGEETKV